MQNSHIKLIVIVIGILAAAGIAAAIYRSSTPAPAAELGGTSPSVPAPNAPQEVNLGEIDPAFQIETEPAGPAESTAPTQGSFRSYVPNLIATANASNKVVLFFSADWCPTCQAAKAELNKSGVPSGLTVLEVDYDNAKELRKKYGVTYQHTFVQVDASGAELKQWAGSRNGSAIATQTI